MSVSSIRASRPGNTFGGAILAGTVSRRIEAIAGRLAQQERRKRASGLLAGVQRDGGVEIGEVLRPGNVRRSEAVIVGVVVIVAPLERVGAVNLGHVVPNSTTMLSDPFGAPTPVLVPSLKFSMGKLRLQSGQR